MRKVDVKEKSRDRELRMLQEWEENNTFQESIDNREGEPHYVVYEGPPTANGKPHVGHVLGRVIKDFIARYKTMSGYQVLRKGGWDTHGLPVELEVEKSLGISGKKEIEEYGIEQFVEKCRDSVFEYEKQWRELTAALGYWVDMDDPYITLKNEYIESVWAILSHIHQKGLLTKGHRVSPYCPSCQTTLSSHEVAQGYEHVKDLSVTVQFKSKDSEDIFLGWTTTPWTLPANVALAVDEDMEYARVKQDNNVFVLANSLVEEVMEGEYELLSTHKGSEFIGMTYTPPFSFVDIERGHTVIAGDFVSDESGTGIVHIAPAHGEDDYRVSQQNGLSMLQVVDSSGRYIDAVTPFAGRFVKDCDVDIVKHLAEHGVLYSKEKYEHSYPFCWRCKTPLLYYAIDSWFIKTTAVKEQLIANNRQVDWYPDHLQEGRFGNFLENVIDWNIGRNRYWGTPLNVWICEGCGEEHAPDSVADMRGRSTTDVGEVELHKPYIDQVELLCTSCGGTMKRTPEVIDVWFDSGSMPFAQYHHPFENEELFQQQYPADMICEGIDQTRGWFYSLMAVSTLYTGKPPYKRVMSTGHILDENGQKMSKSKGNVIDPWELIDELGADALRWSLLSSSAPWHSKRFSKQIVAEAKSKIIDTLVNTHSFYTLYATIDQFDSRKHKKPTSQPLLDRWVLSRLNSTIKDVKKGLDDYDFLNPARRIEELIDDVSNWYIRRSRDRFWGSEMTEDKSSAYHTLREVLLQLSRMMAPFVPFIAEDVFTNLQGGGSVHLTDYPQVNEEAIDESLEEQMQQVRHIVESARTIRNKTGIKTRQPLAELIVIAKDGQPVKIEGYEDIVKEEINVKEIRYPQSEQFLMSYSLKLDFKVAGPKFGSLVKEIGQYVTGLGAEAAKEIMEQGSFEFQPGNGDAVTVTLEELIVEEKAKSGYAVQSGDVYTVALNTQLTDELKQEGLVREYIRAIQDYRKKINLPVEKRIDLVLDVNPQAKEALTSFEHVLRENVLVNELSFGQQDDMEQLQVGSETIRIAVDI